MSALHPRIPNRRIPNPVASRAPSPESRVPSEFQRHSPRAPAQRHRARDDGGGLLPFEHFLQPQPGGHGNPPQGVGGRVGQVEGHERHAARLQDEVRGLQRALDGPVGAGLTAAGGEWRKRRGRGFAAHPEQAVQAHAGGRHRLHVEHVEGVHQRRQFAPGRRAPPAWPSGGWSGPTSAGRRFPRTAQAGGLRQAVDPERLSPSSSFRSPLAIPLPLVTGTRVRSSFFARSNASTSARQVAGMGGSSQLEPGVFRPRESVAHVSFYFRYTDYKRIKSESQEVAGALPCRLCRHFPGAILKEVRRAARRVPEFLHDVRVDHRRLDVGVAEVLLDLPDVHAVEQQMGRKAVPGVPASPRIDPIVPVPRRICALGRQAAAPKPAQTGTVEPSERCTGRASLGRALI